MYRSVTLMAIKAGVAFTDEDALVQLIHENAISFKQTDQGQLVFINDNNVTEDIRQPEVTNNVSEVSAHEAVRRELVKKQQEIAKASGVVMDGRDIGTAVLPNAEVKIFLVASVVERAERRYKENQSKGIMTDFQTLKEEIEHRDLLDSTRKISPLKKAADAELLDTTGMTIQQVVTSIKEIVEKKLAEIVS